MASRDDDAYRKQVAIKFVQPELDSHDLLNRFRNERQTLAGLDHPNIVKLLDGGSTPEGVPFLVMDYVEGSPINDYCDQHKLCIDERLHLFSKVCEAVQYAHQKLVVHRDLKPSNILVTADGTPKLLDFGIAKVLNSQPSAQALSLTQTGARCMTPAYASPEQVSGKSITTRTDIYSLGVVLYELLTGRRPYRLTQHTPAEIERAICEQDPETPSAAVSRVETDTSSSGIPITKTPEVVSETREGHPEKLRRRLRGDLDNIVLKALQKEPQRRYGSVTELSQDVDRHLQHLPVKARPSTFTYHVLKFVQRHKTEVSAAVIVLLTLCFAAAGVFWSSTTTQPTVIERRLTANPEDAPVTSAVISPDGKYLAYTDKTGFYLKQVDNGETHPVPLPKGFEPQAESWFPDSIHMVVSWSEGAQGLPSIWEISVLGGTPRKLAEGGIFPRVSPDGSTIAYLAGGMLPLDNKSEFQLFVGHTEIWLIQADGGRAQRVVGGTEAEARDYFSPVAWAPDGRRAAYVRTTIVNGYNGRETQLEVADVSTGKVDVVLSKPGLGRAIGWVHNDRLLHSVQEPEPNQNDFTLWRVQLDSRTARPLGAAMRVASGRGFAADLSVTKDGKLLALRREQYRGGTYLADVAEGGKRLGTPKRLTLDERGNYPTSWMPDSRTVMFVSDRDGPFHIFKQAIDSTQPELLVGGDETLATPRLNPNATELLYLVMPRPGQISQTVRIMRVPLTGGSSQLVLEAPWIGNQQCARLPSTLCIYSQHDPNQMRFFTFDPVTGSRAEITAARIENSGGYNHWSLSPDGNYLASAKPGPKGVPEIRIFSIADSSKKTIAVPHTEGIGGVDWAADGTSVRVSVAKNNDTGFGNYVVGAVYSVDLSGKIINSLENDAVWFAQAIPSPDGRRVAILGETVNSNVWLLENF